MLMYSDNQETNDAYKPNVNGVIHCCLCCHLLVLVVPANLMIVQLVLTYKKKSPPLRDINVHI